ncbi:MAG: cobalt/magnesium transport protein CorA [Chitinophagales bacterium]|nr:MAG: cobalt/magnesium transport protein CorA [Chitinophagales bacterium]
MNKKHKNGKKRPKIRKTGLPPGSLVYIGEERSDPVRITLFNYTADSFIEKEVQSVEECLPYRDEKSVTWINVNGVHDTALISRIGELFNLHPLLLEDVVNTHQRPKVDDYDDHLFIVMRMMTYNEEKKSVENEQISFVLAKNFVLSFQQREGDLFGVIRERIRDNKSKIRNFGNDYLVYRMIDVIVDHYFIIIEKIGDIIEELEKKLEEGVAQSTLEVHQQIRNDFLMIRKAIYPLREVLSLISKDPSSLISRPTQKFFRDVYDHTIQIIETLEMYREMISGIRDTYHSYMNTEMNRSIQTLTIISVIFIPLTFIAGIYGMNFEYMPELKWKWGYPAVLAVMVCVFLVMIFYFRRRRWL